MDLLEKIHFNRVIHQVMAQLHSPLLSHDEIRNLQTSLNSLIQACPNKQINEQAQTLLHQLAVKSTALYYAEDSKHHNNFLGIVMSPIDLVELLTQHDGIGWGVLSKNNSLWQIMLKYSKNIEHSIWVEHLGELTVWLDSQMENAYQHQNTQKAAFGSSDPQTGQTKAPSQAVPEKKELPDFNNLSSKPAPTTPSNPTNQLETFELSNFDNISNNKPTQAPNQANADFKLADFDELSMNNSSSQNKTSDEFVLADFHVDNHNKVINPFDAMRAELDQNVAISTSNSAQQQNFNIEPTLELTTTMGSTAIPKSSAMADKAGYGHVSYELLEQATQQAVAQLTSQQVAVTPAMIEQITTTLAEKLSKKVALSSTEPNPLTQTLKKEVVLPKPIQLPKPVEKPQTHTSALNDNITVDFASFPAPSTNEDDPQAQKTITNTAMPSLSRNTNVEAWDCEFELGQYADLSYFNIQLKKYFSFINLITLNTDMSKIQNQPVYMTEVLDSQNQFKHYLLVFGSNNTNQAVTFITQLTHHQQDTIAHIAQITWQEFKKYVFDLTQCCQLYHTAPIVMKSHSLYSHIVESLISKQQMLYIEEMTADNNTPLLLLQENSRFRVIHGRNRLDMGASLEMYPCIILSRNSGITWQMIREQLKFLPQPVNVYQLFEALQHATHLE